MGGPAIGLHLAAIVTRVSAELAVTFKFEFGPREVSIVALELHIDIVEIFGGLAVEVSAGPLIDVESHLEDRLGRTCGDQLKLIRIVLREFVQLTNFFERFSSDSHVKCTGASGHPHTPRTVVANVCVR